MRKLTVGSLFAGIGGFDLGLERAGFEIKWQVEIDPFCRKVLEKHWPAVRRYQDVEEVHAGTVRTCIWGIGCRECLAAVDVLCGGFPCQDVSAAGLRTGIEGKRSGLWKQFARLIGELRPRYVLVENVPGLLDRGMGVVLGDLAALGFDAEWSVLSACAVGAPHTRERVFLVAYPEGQRPGQLRWEWSAAEREAQRHLHWPASEPACERVAYGVSDGSHRLTALGNSIVPALAEFIGRRILDAERVSA
jgi:DNA (cytosine-5)-methyltransferase 1